MINILPHTKEESDFIFGLSISSLDQKIPVILEIEYGKTCRIHSEIRSKSKVLPKIIQTFTGYQEIKFKIEGQIFDEIGKYDCNVEKLADMSESLNIGNFTTLQTNLKMEYYR